MIGSDIRSQWAKDRSLDVDDEDNKRLQGLCGLWDAS